MKSIAIAGVLLVLAAGVYLSCSDGVSHLGELTDRETFDGVMILHVGESVHYVPENLKIGFKQTTYECRCPMNAYCFWSGMARIQLWFLKSELDTAFATPAIIGNGEDSNSVRYLSAEVLGYRASLLRLDPYPQDFDSPDPDEYIATIKVETIDGDSHSARVIITDNPPESVLLDPYWVDALSIDGDMLSVDVHYAGGCKPHRFELYMSPAAFAETYPAQADLYLRHDSNGDMCEAVVSEVVTFDVTPIAALFTNQYPESQGKVQLNVHEFTGDDYTSHQSILYMF